LAGHAGRLPASGLERGIGQQQDALAGDLQAHAFIDEAHQAGRALAVEHLVRALRVLLQDLVAAVLDRDPPGVPQRRGEQGQRQDAQQLM
jgi:hypothetical protein